MLVSVRHHLSVIAIKMWCRVGDFTWIVALNNQKDLVEPKPIVELHMI